MANLSAAKLQDKDIYDTLPFNAITTNHEVVKTIMYQTRTKWLWFEDGQRRNPAFGTLSYLPVEVRWMIWMQVSLWVMNNPVHAFYLWWHCSMARGSERVPDGEEHIPILRKALPLVALEIDQLYLSRTTVRLKVCWTLSHVWDRKLASWQLPWVRHLSIKLDTEHGQGELWIRLFETQQLPNLSTLTLDLKHDHCDVMHYLDANFGCCVGDSCRRGRKKSTRNSARTSKDWTCEHSKRRKFHSNTLRRELALLEVVTKVVARRTPGVTLRLGEANACCERCHEKCKAILDDVEY